MRRSRPLGRPKLGGASTRETLPRPGYAGGPLARLRWVIARIPRGRVATYGQIATVAGMPRAARLTVWALRGSAGLPWHRVVAAGGRIALPGISGVEQRLRLQLEGVLFRGSRVRMDLHGWTTRTAPVRRGKGEGAPRRAAIPRLPVASVTRSVVRLQAGRRARRLSVRPTPGASVPFPEGPVPASRRRRRFRRPRGNREERARDYALGQ